MYERAVILGASGGIGQALVAVAGAAAPAKEVIGLSRSADGFDVTDEASVQDAAERIGQADLVIIATGALEIGGIGPEKSFSQLSAKAMAQQFAVNTIGPALCLKHFMRRLPRDRRGVIAALSARVGSIGDNGLGGWMSYRASKAALNQVLRCASVELGRTHPQALCLALHPGTVATPFTEAYAGSYERTPPEQAAAQLFNVIAAQGPAESGGFFDQTGKPVPW